jgi:prolyl 4-hydroxylase
VNTPAFNDAWKAWVLSNVDRGCSRQSMVNSMVEAGWPIKIARGVIEYVLQEREEIGVANVVPKLKDMPASVRLLLSLKTPPIQVFSNLLSEDECDLLIELARPRLKDSSVVDGDTGKNVPSDGRISEGMFFSLSETPVIAQIEDRLVKMFDWLPKHHESIQVLHYLPGGRYDSHYDYFRPDTQSVGKLTERAGQRLGTVLLYLNTPEEGGGTGFTDIGLEVAAQKGNAVFFSYDRPHPSTKTLHAGLPVMRGEKWVATFWFREKAT